MKEAGGEGIDVDWRISIGRARGIIGPDFALERNLDPAMLLAPRELRVRRVREILAQAGAANR